ncbi:Arc family DNA-binding protein [Rhizobium mongolense]
MTDQSPSRLLDKIIIRVPDGMRERIKRVADANGRSVNAELLVLLEKSYPSQTKIDEHIREIAAAVENIDPHERHEFWRSIFEKLETIRKDTV